MTSDLCMRSRFLGTTTLLLTVTTVSLQVSKCMELEEQCREEEKQHWARVAALIQVPLSCSSSKNVTYLGFARGTRQLLPHTKASMRG